MQIGRIWMLMLFLCTTAAWADVTFQSSWRLAHCHNSTDVTVCPTTPTDWPTESREFREQVRVAMVRVAGQIQGEASTGRTPNQLRKRAGLAANILSVQLHTDGTFTAGVELWLPIFVEKIAEGVTATGVSTDADIEFLATSVWDDVAGVSGVDLNL